MQPLLSNTGCIVNQGSKSLTALQAFSPTFMTELNELGKKLLLVSVGAQEQASMKTRRPTVRTVGVETPDQTARLGHRVYQHLNTPRQKDDDAECVGR